MAQGELQVAALSPRERVENRDTLISILGRYDRLQVYRPDGITAQQVSRLRKRGYQSPTGIRARRYITPKDADIKDTCVFREVLSLAG